MREAFGLFKPQTCEVADEKVMIKTNANMDFWKRTYYGFQNNHAPALLIKTGYLTKKK